MTPNDKKARLEAIKVAFDIEKKSFSLEPEETDLYFLISELSKAWEQIEVARAELKAAEGYMFLACQPNQGDLFGEFDEKNQKALERMDKIEAGE